MSIEATESQPKRSRMSLMLTFLLFVGVGSAAVWANLWKEDLRVLDVQVKGNGIVSAKEIVSLAGIAKGEKLFEVDLFAVQKRIMKNQFLRSASVNREAPGRVSITVEERVPIASAVMDRILYLDAEGYVLPPAVSEHIFDLPVVTGTLSSAEFRPGEQISSESAKEGIAILAIALDLDDELYRRISEVRVEAGKDIIAYTAEAGVPVIFGRGDTGMKLVKFDAFWKQFVATHGAHELAYVDLRFADQVVVRWNYDTKDTKATRNAPRVDVKRKGSALILPAAVIR